MINIDALNDDEKLAALESIHKSIAESKEIQKKKITTNVELIVKALKKIESDLKQRYDETGQLIANLKNGEDGRDGKDGKDGKNGRDGRDGPVGPRGYDGVPGRNGLDGADGVSITDAHIDFDGSLIIHLSSGRVINVGEVVAADIAEKIKVITNGGGTSQGVLDAIASLQAQIDSIASGLEYQGTWNASTNVPTLASSVGTAGYYYIVATAGSTNLNGVTDWQIGDWAVFNGSVWQKIDQTNLVTSVAGRTGAVTLSTSDISGLGTIATQAANNVSITGGSITGITDLAIADGGTGASTAANARTNLGLVIGTDVLSPTGSAASLTSFPTFNQNTTGTAANVTGTVAIANGGTGATTAGTARTALGATTVGANVFTLTNPSAITFPRFNADNTVSALDAATFRTAIGAGTSSTTGTVTSVAASVPTFLSIAGSPITSSGTLAITLSGTALPTTSGGTGLTSYTANGIVYASSTSALTTGSGLTFDGTNLGVLSAGLNVGDGTTTLRSVASGGVGLFGTSTNHPLAFRLNNTEEMRLTSTGLGIGTTTPAAKLDVTANAVVMGYFRSSGGLANDQRLTFTSGGGRVVLDAATNSTGASSAFGFTLGGTEGMRLTTTGLGIGTSSPISKLANTATNTADAAGLTAGTPAIQWSTGVQGYVAAFSNTGVGSQFANGLLVKTTGTSNDADAIVNFESGGVNRLKLTGAGNLGLGVTPSAWGTGYKAIQLLTSALYGTTSRDMNLGANVYVDAVGYKYIQTSFATNYTQYQGVHSWYTAPSGTAGNAITFTQAMTLDASGVLLVGRTSPSISGVKVDAEGLFGSIKSGNWAWSFGASTATNAFVINDTTSGSSVERCRIDSSGNFMVGTTSAGGVGITAYASGYVRANTTGTTLGQYQYSSSMMGTITTDGANIAYNANNALVFGSGGTTERARIDSSGNLLVGTTSTDIWTGSATNTGFKVESNGTTTISRSGFAAVLAKRTTSDGNVMEFARGTAQVGSVSVTATATAYNTSSDQRLKENIVDAPEFGSVIDSIKVRSYDWRSDGSHQRAGFVAQELVTVAPEAVHQPEDSEEMMAVDYSKLVPMLVKEIQSLRKRLADAGI